MDEGKRLVIPYMEIMKRLRCVTSDVCTWGTDSSLSFFFTNRFPIVTVGYLSSSLNFFLIIQSFCRNCCFFEAFRYSYSDSYCHVFSSSGLLLLVIVTITKFRSWKYCSSHSLVDICSVYSCLKPKCEKQRIVCLTHFFVLEFPSFFPFSLLLLRFS